MENLQIKEDIVIVSTRFGVYGNRILTDDKDIVDLFSGKYVNIKNLCKEGYKLKYQTIYIDEFSQKTFLLLTFTKIITQ